MMKPEYEILIKLASLPKSEREDLVKAALSLSSIRAAAGGVLKGVRAGAKMPLNPLTTKMELEEAGRGAGAVFKARFKARQAAQAVKSISSKGLAQGGKARDITSGRKARWEALKGIDPATKKSYGEIFSKMTPFERGATKFVHNTLPTIGYGAVGTAAVGGAGYGAYRGVKALKRNSGVAPKRDFESAPDLSQPLLTRYSNQ